MVLTSIENTHPVISVSSTPFALLVQPQSKEEQFERNAQVIALITSFIGDRLKNSNLKGKLIKAMHMKKKLAVAEGKENTFHTSEVARDSQSQDQQSNDGDTDVFCKSSGSSVSLLF